MNEPVAGMVYKAQVLGRWAPKVQTPQPVKLTNPWTHEAQHQDAFKHGI